MSIDIKDALGVVNRKINIIGNISGIELQIMHEQTIDRQFYWVFFYNSKTFLETGNLSFALAGNSPLIVDKINGEIFETGTARPIDFYMERFEKEMLPLLKIK